MRTFTPHPSDRFSEQLLLNAHCIDFVYGGVYAWAYLAMAGVRDQDIVSILRTPFERWHTADPDIATTAHRAMDSIGIQRPVVSHICTMP